MDLTTFINEAMTANPVEARIARKVYNTLRDAGDPINEVFDGEEFVKVATQREFLEVLFNLDEVKAYTLSGGWVMLINGESWDMISDYTIDLEDMLKPVTEYIYKHSN
jgi:hypothetical protein